MLKTSLICLLFVLLGIVSISAEEENGLACLEKVLVDLDCTATPTNYLCVDMDRSKLPSKKDGMELLANIDCISDPTNALCISPSKEDSEQHATAKKAAELIRQYQAQYDKGFLNKVFDEWKCKLQVEQIESAEEFARTCKVYKPIMLDRLFTSDPTPEKLLLLRLVEVFTFILDSCLDSLNNVAYLTGFLVSSFPPLNIALAQLAHFVPALAPAVDWLFVVPKGDFVTKMHLICLAIRIPNLLLVFLVVTLYHSLARPGSVSGAFWEWIVEAVSKGLNLFFKLVAVPVLFILNACTFVYNFGVDAVHFLRGLCRGRAALAEPPANEKKKKDE